MASLSNNERNVAIDALLAATGEDVRAAARVLKTLRASMGSIPWDTLLRTRSAGHQPFVDAGVIGPSVTWWCDEVIRISNEATI